MVKIEKPGDICIYKKVIWKRCESALTGKNIFFPNWFRDGKNILASVETNY